MLHIKCQQIKCAHRAEGQKQHRQVGACSVTILKQPQWNQRIFTARLNNYEDGQEDACCSKRQQGVTVGPPMFAGTGNAIDKRSHAADAGDGAGEIEAALVQIRLNERARAN
jgi:hypothetical protein